MKAILLILTVLAAAVLTPSASADGLPVVGVVDPSELGGQIRYEALPVERDTFVQRTESGTGTLLQSRTLHGRFEIPVVAYDGSPGGLSANGQVLVVISPRSTFPRRQTEFAVLDARTLKVLRRLSLRGDYSFDALSPDGRWMYLIHYTARKDSRRYEVRVLDVRTGKLEPKPIVDPREPDEKMNGNPLTRATSPDGRWAYTLYDGTEHPFVHALDTARRDARCIDLDWLTGAKSLRALRFALRDEGRELIVRAPDGEHVAVVDTTTFEAARPSAAGIASWPTLGLSSLALLLAVAGLVYVIRVRSRSASP